MAVKQENLKLAAVHALKNRSYECPHCHSVQSEINNYCSHCGESLADSQISLVDRMARRNWVIALTAAALASVVIITSTLHLHWKMNEVANRLVAVEFYLGLEANHPPPELTR